jgi:hypothetical protein
VGLAMGKVPVWVQVRGVVLVLVLVPALEVQHI